MTTRLLTSLLTSALLLTACSGGPERDAAPRPPGAPAVPSPADGSLAPTSAAPKPSPTGLAAPAPGCPLFPADNVWHSAVTSLPVHARSRTYVASIGVSRRLHPDFGAGLIDGGTFGIPVNEVRPGQRTSRVTFDYADESDPGPYPIPTGVKIEGAPGAGGDRHVILHDAARCKLYELYDARQRGGAWQAGSGAVFDLRSNGLRPAGWTSADAAGLPIMAGLVRYEEVARGRIDHAIRVTVPRSQNAYVWPARHAASRSSDPALPPMGLRLRLKASVDISRLPRQSRVIAQALKTYGVIVADNGSPWFITGTADNRWNNDDLNALKAFTGAQFEAVDASRLRISPNSGAARR